MKKALIVSQGISFGGVTTSLINISKMLVRLGYDVTIVISEDRVEKSQLQRFPSEIHFRVVEEKQHPVLAKLPYFWAKCESGYWTTHTKASRVYQYFVGKDTYDIEIAFYFGRPVKIISGSPNNYSKKIMWVRLGFWNGNKGNYAGFPTTEKAIEAFSKYDSIICVSEELRDNFIENTGISKGVLAIHNYLDKENIDKCLEEPCPLEKKGFTISCVCRLVPIKNIYLLLNVVKRLIDEHIECYLWLIGDGELREDIKRFIQDKNIAQNVVLAGKQNNPHKYVKASDLYVFPSFMEGYPNTIADSIYIGTPIVTTRCTGAADIVRQGKYGILVDFSEDHMYEAVKKMITDRDTYMHYKNIQKECDFEAEAKEIDRQLLEIFDPPKS